MNVREMFPPTLEAALTRCAAINPADYARTRNYVDGAVTRLSPYITHGFLSVPRVLAEVSSHHAMSVQHKFVYELGWREYFHHVWYHRGDAILHSLHEGVLPDAAYNRELPADIREGRTGVPVVDQAVRTLYATGYLHNHARMWLASYIVHLRKVYWRAGADWMIAHLLDGDLASNHLSWQWVAGTGSSKPYLFNAENVARFAPAVWHSAGSVLDTSYEALDAIARGERRVPAQSVNDGVEEPPLLSQPAVLAPPHAPDVEGRNVWLVHPWALGEAPVTLPTDCLHVGWWPAEYHATWRWSGARWLFVRERMSALTCVQWYGTTQQLDQALAGARSVRTMDSLHIAALLPPRVRKDAVPNLFPHVDGVCDSFSAWWNRTTRGIEQLADLPGIATLGGLT